MARWKWRILIFPSVLSRSFLLSSSSFYIGPRAERATQSLPEPLLLSGDSFLDDGGTYAAYDSRKELPSRVTPPPPLPPFHFCSLARWQAKKNDTGRKKERTLRRLPRPFLAPEFLAEANLGRRSERCSDSLVRPPSRRILRVTGVAASRENAPRKNA